MEYRDVAAANDAVVDYDGHTIDGNTLKVELTSRYRAPPEPLYTHYKRRRSRSPEVIKVESLPDPDPIIPADHDISEGVSQDITRNPLRPEASHSGYELEMPQPVKGSTSFPEESLLERWSYFSSSNSSKQQSPGEGAEEDSEKGSELGSSEEADFVPMLTPARRRKLSDDRESISIRSSRRKVRRPQRYSPDSAIKAEREAMRVKDLTEAYEEDRIIAEDGTAFSIIDKLDDGLKVICSLCGVEIKSQSMSSHLKSKSHQRHL